MVIGFIGLGNMAKAMISGILGKGIVAPEQMIGSARTQETCDRVSKEFGIETTTDNVKVANMADILFLAIKPQMFRSVVPGLKGVTKDNAMIVSIAAGKSIDDIENMLGDGLKVVRLMPNTPAMVNQGCTAICANEKVESKDLDLIVKICDSFGESEIIDEKLMDAFCAVAGSSPAYVFMYMEALADAAVKAGIPRDKAYKFAACSTMGSAKLMLETGKHPGVLKDMVCSPGGTTIEAVRVLENMGFRSAVMEAVEACIERSKEL
ncbi:MAG: pyrroline-5-carboxylate reductase [Lachnospiraceae bacterium]|nr:pyrroline-5-carboxylate reductase [Lachnospiraceae bacterium]